MTNTDVAFPPCCRSWARNVDFVLSWLARAGEFEVPSIPFGPCRCKLGSAHENLRLPMPACPLAQLLQSHRRSKLQVRASDSRRDMTPCMSISFYLFNVNDTGSTGPRCLSRSWGVSRGVRRFVWWSAIRRWILPSRGFGWRIHCGVEVTESSTTKQLSLSDPHQPVLLLLRAARDESHRVALSRHRRARSRALLSKRNPSALIGVQREKIDGCGVSWLWRQRTGHGPNGALRRASYQSPCLGHIDASQAVPGKG